VKFQLQSPDTHISSYLWIFWNFHFLLKCKLLMSLKFFRVGMVKFYIPFWQPRAVKAQKTWLVAHHLRGGLFPICISPENFVLYRKWNFPVVKKLKNIPGIYLSWERGSSLCYLHKRTMREIGISVYQMLGRAVEEE
jgi:hypothetical protein